MAAKVVMVAVPTVLGIASIRVYTVKDAPTDGLPTREKLNIYTPLNSAVVKFVPRSPGLLERGLTTSREGVLPVYLAVKGACISVKRGTVNLYHAGQDVYYYLKDPPPEFLPRFGTITMAGLLGMLLARKGSRYQQVAVPVSLMTAAVTVCYPAQAVAVCKVSGKKVYAAGQWSSAAVSSLFTSKEPVAKEIVASPPQTAKVPDSESAEASEPTDLSVQAEVEPAESTLVSNEPVISGITEEESSLTLSEAGPGPAPAETSTDPSLNAVPLERETSSSTEATIESEEGGSKQAAEEVSADTSPADPTPTAEPETVEVVPVEAAPVEAATVEVAPAEVAPAEVAPAEVAPAEVAPAEVAAAEVAPAEVAPAEVAAAEPAPAEPAPAEVAAAEPAPAEPAPAEPAPAEPAPVEPAPEEPAPVEAAPVESAPVESAPVESAPVESAPEESAPVEPAPVEPAPEESAPVEAAPVESAPVEPAPVESAPVEAAPPEASVPEVESAEPQLTDQLPVAATPSPPSPSEQPAAEDSKEGASFKPDPAMVDFGQSSPEDEDLYTTRS